MKEFLTSKVGNVVLGAVLALIIFVFLRVFIFDGSSYIGAAIAGGIAGGVGFGGAAAIKGALTKGET